VASAVIVPVWGDEEILGTIQLGSRTLRYFTTGQVHLLEAIGRHVGIAWQKARLSEESLQAREQRQRVEEQLRQAQKMEAVGVLAGGVAHDFNNLLTAIIGFSELALGRLGPGDSSRPLIEEVTRAGERASVLTRQLLAFSRQQVLLAEVVDLNTTVASMDRLLQRVIGEDVELVTFQAPDLGRVLADPGQLEQVILNLAVNARDAMPRGGKLTISTANVVVGPDDVGPANELAAGCYVRLAVSDTGVGMDAATAARIFEPFFTTKGPDQGTGLGLSMVYGVVKQSNGEIRVYSEPGRGTTFNVYLPNIADAVASEAPVEMAPAPMPGSETILVVEDNAAVRALATSVLASKGYTVLEADAGDAALELLDMRTESVDLMTGMSGVELARQVRARHPSTKVLFMSGYPGEVTVRHGLLAAADAYLGKPFGPTTLLQKVRELLDPDPVEPMQGATHAGVGSRA
jgi:signal transduction histidine kinase/ActR/RegA family two-component response regulator